jgi:predicted hydrocarbon binding protein
MGCNKLHEGQGSVHHLKEGLLDGGTQEFLKIDYRVRERVWVSRRFEEKS